MKIKLVKVFEFHATHYLTGMVASHECSIEHGHDYKLEVTISAPRGLKNGLVIDTGRLKVDVAPVIKRVRGKCLNDLKDPSEWGQRLAAQPSVEHFAWYFWDALAFLNNSGFCLERVRVYESEKIYAEVTR